MLQGPEGKFGKVISLTDHRIARVQGGGWDIPAIIAVLSADCPPVINDTSPITLFLRLAPCVLPDQSTKPATLVFNPQDMSAVYRYGDLNPSQVTINDTSAITVGEDRVIFNSSGVFNHRTEILRDGTCVVRILSPVDSLVLNDEKFTKSFDKILEKGSNRWDIRQIRAEFDSTYPRLQICSNVQSGLAVPSSVLYESGEQKGNSFKITDFSHINIIPGKEISFLSQDALIQSFMLMQRDGQVIFTTIPNDSASRRMLLWLEKQAKMREWKPRM